MLRLSLKIDGKLQYNIPPWLKSLNIDPTAPLSSLDVARILMNYCDHRIEENNAEERYRIDEELKAIINTLGSLAKTFRAHADSTDTVLADIALKMNTFSLYFEQLLNNIKSGLHDAFFKVGSDMRKVFCSIKSLGSHENHSSTESNHIHENLVSAANEFSSWPSVSHPPGYLSPHSLPRDPSLHHHERDRLEPSTENEEQLVYNIDSDHDVNIPQLDGAPAVLPGPSNDTTTRTTNFVFNKIKQIEKIKKDADINDYIVTVNNNDQNSTIKCSTGFYMQVARASLGTLKDNSVLSCGDIAIKVDKITISKDQLGTESTKLIQFSFMNGQRSIGGVAVHLHHSNRTVQIQGSAVMPDSSRAALWFLNFVLLRFKDQARAKNFEIKNTNATFRNSVTSHKSNTDIHSQNPDVNSSCMECNRGFNTQSKPSRCTKCENFFHKTNCLREHKKICHAKPSQSKGNEQTHVSASLATDVCIPTYTQSLIPNLRTSLTFVPSNSSSSQSLNSTLENSPSATFIPVSQPSLRTLATSSATSIVTTTTVSQSRIMCNPSSVAPPRSPIPTTTVTSSPTTTHEPETNHPGGSRDYVPPALSPLVTATNPPKPKKKSKVSLSITPDQARINFLQTELAGAQARIVQLDANLKEKDQRVTILTAKIKVLEDENTKAVYDKYFPHASNVRTPPDPHADKPTSPLNTTARCLSCSRAPPVCGYHCQPPSHCQYQPQRCSPHQTCPQLPNSDTLLSAINNLKADINDLKKVSVSLQSSFETLKVSSISATSPFEELGPEEPDQIAKTPPVSTTSETADISVASIEEFMETVDDAVENDEVSCTLNYPVPTTHQQ